MLTHVVLLALLDLSAAFDCVDHDVLLRRLRVRFGICGTAHDWNASLLIPVWSVTAGTVQGTSISRVAAAAWCPAGISSRSHLVPAVHS